MQEIKIASCPSSKVIPRPIEIPAAAIRRRTPRCRGVERREGLHRYVTVAGDSKGVGAVVDEAVALTGQQRGVGDGCERGGARCEVGGVDGRRYNSKIR